MHSLNNLVVLFPHHFLVWDFGLLRLMFTGSLTFLIGACCKLGSVVLVGR